MPGKGKPKGKGDAERESMSHVRMAELEDALLSGRSHGWCVEHFAEQWKVTERQVRNYIARVEEHWKATAPTATPALRELARQRVLLLWRMSMADRADVPGAYAAARGAIDMLNKIDAVYAPQAIRVDSLPLGMSEEEYRRIVAEEAARLGDG